MTIEKIKNKIIPIAITYGVPEIALFGSAARGELNENSDIDLIIERANCVVLHLAVSAMT